MTKQEYKAAVNVEVYMGENKKLSLKQKFLSRYFDSSKNAVYLIRRYQYVASNIGGYYADYLKRLLIRKYGIFISKNTKIGIGLKLPHPNGIIIGKNVTIGENCTIFQQVTIGGSRDGDSLAGNQPIIEDNCTFYSGCKVLGKITVSRGVKVGANSVLLHDTEQCKTYVGCPARKVERNN